MTRILYVSLFLFSIFLFFLSVEEQEVKYKIEKEKNARIVLMNENVKKIGFIENEYRKRKGFYEQNTDSLMNFIKNEKYIKTKINSYFDTLKLKNKDSIVEFKKIDTLRIISIKDSLFDKNYNISELFLLVNSQSNKKVTIRVTKLKYSQFKIKEKVSIKYNKKDLLLDLNKNN